MKRLPVHVVTGFLGSGKTTLLNQLLRQPGFEKTAVIVNEFGQIGLDHLFIEGRADGMFELSNGCLCCTIRGELANTLLALPKGRVDKVIVETTGLADPVPVLQAILCNPQVAQAFEAASLTTLVDGLAIERQLQEHREARQQIALADRIIVTKLDMLAPAERSIRLARLEAAIRVCGALAPIIAKAELTVSPNLFETNSLCLADRLPSPLAHQHHQHDVNRHGENINATVLRCSCPIPRHAIEMFCELLTTVHAPNLLRLKGLVKVAHSGGPMVIHAIHSVLHEPEILPRWPDGDHSTRIVAILRDLDPAIVHRLFSGVANLPQPDTPDRDALMSSPLTIPGYRQD